MKKIINGGSAMMLFVASFLLFGCILASCSNNTAGQSPNPINATAIATPNCAKCTPVNFSQDTTGLKGGPKIILVGRTMEAIPAGTDIKIEVLLSAASAKAGN